MMKTTLRSSSSVHLVSEHVAEEADTESALPPTINMPLNELVKRKKKERREREERRRQIYPAAGGKGKDRINEFST